MAASRRAVIETLSRPIRAALIGPGAAALEGLEALPARRQASKQRFIS
jgi:hypothetical protein